MKYIYETQIEVLKLREATKSGKAKMAGMYETHRNYSRRDNY